MSALLLLLGIAVIVFGVVALVAPILPRVAIIYLGILIVAWADHFTRIGPVMLFAMLGLMLVALEADNLAALFGARRAGARTPAHDEARARADGNGQAVRGAGLRHRCGRTAPAPSPAPCRTSTT